MSGKTVLVMEDHESPREAYALLLADCGYQAAHGGEAIPRVHQHRPDRVLMDIALPVLDGWGAARLLKASRESCGIPIVAFTAHALAGDRVRAEQAVFDGYLTKPVPLRDVLNELRVRLGMSGPVPFAATA